MCYYVHIYSQPHAFLSPYIIQKFYIFHLFLNPDLVRSHLCLTFPLTRLQCTHLSLSRCRDQTLQLKLLTSPQNSPHLPLFQLSTVTFYRISCTRSILNHLQPDLCYFLLNNQLFAVLTSVMETYLCSQVQNSLFILNLQCL